ncbi:MAG: insulinase family protein [Clostridia bacterium]|nr:insulinase family protein [Clostridia bacterium]
MTPQFLSVGRYGKLIYLQTDRFKSELLSLSFAVPLTVQAAQQNAMVVALSRRGTKTYPSQAALNRKLDLLYSTAISTANRRMGDMQMLTFTADFLGADYVGGGKGLLPEVVSVLGELVGQPFFDATGQYPADVVSSEKQVLRDAIRAEINNPRALAGAGARKLLCKGEPYGLSLIGSKDTVDALTPEVLACRYRALLSEIAPVFSYVGKASAAEVVALLESTFSFLDKAPASYAADLHAHVGEVRRGTRLMPLQQGKLSLGFRTDIAPNDPLAPALMLANEIFGGSPASKLFLNVREKRSLCYHCSSALDLYKGVLFAGSGIKSENRAVTEEAMLLEFAALQRGEISDIELHAAKKALSNNYRTAQDNPAVLSRFYTGRTLAGAPVSLEDWRTRMENTTREEVMEAANRIRLGSVYFIEGTGEGGEE